jgi:multiple sugar transport system permease protein
MSQNRKVNKVINTVIIQAVLILFSILMIVPFAWMFLTSFKTVTEATSVNPFVIFPKVWKTDAFVTVWNNMSFPLLYKNTLLLIFWRVVCACLTATFAGYAFARLQFPGKNLMFSLVLIQMMIPSQIFTIPQYTMISDMHMTNTMFALVFPGLVTAFGTFLLRQAYMQLPKDLEEAARLDGCSIPQTFVFIMAPLARSSMVALGYLYRRICLQGTALADGCLHGCEEGAACRGTCNDAGPVCDQLSAADGGISDCVHPDDHSVSDLPEAVHSGYCHIRHETLTGRITDGNYIL